MIRVKNTVELQENYKLSEIADTDEVMVYGGFYGKEKYDRERYRTRVTYSGRDIKNIIVKMQEIESAIPEEWGQIQRAKFIYETLGKAIGYDYDHNKKTNQQSSNLTVLLSREGVCAGYALLYKEMMDRQGISCDYVRGIVPLDDGNVEKHAWNVLNINGKSIPVDLTWDSSKLRKGKKVQNFGDVDFKELHKKDADEIDYDFRYVTSDEYSKINTKLDERNGKEELDVEAKRVFVEEAINETYKKFLKNYGHEIALGQCKGAIKKYIYTGYMNAFTNNNNARENIDRFVSQDDMAIVFSDMYVDMLEKDEISKTNILAKATNETLYKYNKKQASAAVKEYLKNNRRDLFTNKENRDALSYADPSELFDNISESIVLDCVKRKEQSEQVTEKLVQKSTYDSYELSKVADRVPKDKGIIQKAFSWMKNKQEKTKQIEHLEKIANEDYVPRHESKEKDIDDHYTKE